VSLSSKVNFFGVTFLMAMREFEQSKCEYWVIEAGIGGSRSVTNLLKPSVIASCVTSVGFDHMEVLGNTKKDILRDKLGVWKKD
jgi:dihydrofolate synthase / folylpolyglutamate synthase